MGADSFLSPAVRSRIQAAFGEGVGAGLLQLGASELRTELPTSLAWFRRLGQLYMSRLCALTDLEALRERASVPPPSEELARLAASPPLMVGAEYVDAALLERLWSAVESACQRQLAAHSGPIEDWLHARSPLWNRVGRVGLHLAENKRDPSLPFAFLATYATQLSASGRVQHQPLGRALKQSAQSGNLEQLLTLLEPVQRAARDSSLIQELVDSREIYAPQRWDAGQAHRFLREIPALEAAGLSVRVPAWWHTGKPPRPQVSVSIGERQEGGVGLRSMLSFSVDVALDGLVMLRGRWVEVDAEALSESLERWQEIAASAERDGISFVEGMRLLAGAPTELLSDGRIALEGQPLPAILSLLADDATAVIIGDGSSDTAAAVAGSGGTYCARVTGSLADEVALFFHDAAVVEFEEIDHVCVETVGCRLTWVEWVDWLPGAGQWPALSGVIRVEAGDQRAFYLSSGDSALAERTASVLRPGDGGLWLVPYEIGGADAIPANLSALAGQLLDRAGHRSRRARTGAKRPPPTIASCSRCSERSLTRHAHRHVVAGCYSL